MTFTRVVRIGRNLFVVAWLATLAGLAVRSHLLGDERWGFCMFGDIREYRLRWEWVDRHGRATAFAVRGYLSGNARMLADNPHEEGEWALGLGALRSEVSRLAQWLVEHEAPADAGGVRCTIESSEWRVAPWTSEVVAWPVPVDAR